MKLILLTLIVGIVLNNDPTGKEEVKEGMLGFGAPLLSINIPKPNQPNQPNMPNPIQPPYINQLQPIYNLQR